jgi:ComF family protein
LSATIVAHDYVFPWQQLVQALKFQQDTALAGLLAGHLAQAVRHGPAAPAAAPVSLIVPMPLHADRLRQRGYNQSWELARRLARPLGLPARADTLLRWRHTPAQATLGRAERESNVRGAFMPDPRGARALRNRHIALVDDVATTGATAEAAAQAALEAGALSVTLWVVARTPAPA